MDERLIKYQEHLETQRASKVYINYLKLFYDFLIKQSLTLEQVSKDTITLFLQETKDWKPASVNLLINAGRQYFDFIFGEAKDNPFRQVKTLTVDQTMKDYLTLEELNKGIAFIISEMPVNPKQVNAILLFMFYTGLRIGEIMNLKREDFDFELARILVRIPTKRKKERFTYFPPNVSRILQDYFSSEPQEENAFNLTARQIQYMIKKMNLLFPNKKLSPHSLRHSGAKHWIKQGIDIKVVSKLLGHSSLKTTEIYVNPDEEMIKSIYKSKVG